MQRRPVISLLAVVALAVSALSYAADESAVGTATIPTDAGATQTSKGLDAGLDPELVEQAMRLRSVIEILRPVAPDSVPAAPSFVRREDLPDHPSSPGGAPWVAPVRQWPPDAELEDPDLKWRLWESEPGPEELQRWAGAATAAPSGDGHRATVDERTLEEQFDHVVSNDRGAVADKWQAMAFGIRQPSPERYYSGRATQISMAYDPTQSRVTTWAGTLGGLYKVEIFGIFAFWVPVSASLPGSPAVGAFVVRPSDGLQILLGTGDFARAGGDGLYRSVDGGVTWSRRPMTPTPWSIYRLRVDQTNDSVVLAATSSGVFRSSDFGGSWTRITSTDTTDIIQDPTFTSFWYAAQRGTGVLDSDDGGTSFGPIGNASCTGIPGAIGRTELTISPAAANHVFAVVETGGALNGIYRSDNYGCNWTSIDSIDSNSWGQAFHAMAIEVDPTNPSRLFVAMGGGQWTDQALAGSPCWHRNAGGTSDCGLADTFDAGHVDMTDFEFNGADIMISNDGGVFSFTPSNNTIEDMGNGLGFNTLQTVSGLQSLTTSNLNQDFLLAGLQDNGIAKIVNSQATLLSGGDGGIMSISPDDDDRFYASVGLGFRRQGSHNSGSSFFNLDCGLAERGLDGVYREVTPGVAPSLVYLFTMAPDPVTGDEFVWFKPPTTTCDWQKVHGNPLPFAPVAVTQNNDPNRWTLYAWAWADHRVAVMDFDGPGAMTWVDRTPPPLIPLPPGSGDMRLFAERSASLPGTAYYTTATSRPSRAFVTNDRAQSWREVTGNLAAITGNTSFFEMAGDPRDQRTLFVATSVGVFRTDSADQPFPIWYRYMEGMPAVLRAYNLEVSADGPDPAVVRVGTYGSGFWERVIAPTGIIFADGFETGSTSAWD